MGRLGEIIGVAESLGATRLELANVQYYGWAFKNRAQLLPTRQQVDAAMQIALAEKKRLADKMRFFMCCRIITRASQAVHERLGRRYLTVNPIGQVLPCPTASSIPGLRFENVRRNRWRGFGTSRRVSTGFAARNGCHSRARVVRNGTLILADAAARRRC